MRTSAFSRWLNIFCSSFGSLVASKRKSPKMKKDQNWQFLAIISNIGDILLITMDKQNVPWTMYNYLEKAKNFSFLQIDEYFL